MTTANNALRTDPVGYIRRKYNVPGDCKIVVKQGYVTNDRQDLHPLIQAAKDEISALLKAWETDAALQTLGKDQLYGQIIRKVDTMFAGLTACIPIFKKTRG